MAAITTTVAIAKDGNAFGVMTLYSFMLTSYGFSFSTNSARVGSANTSSGSSTFLKLKDPSELS
jgi:hypothetical protein